MARSSNLACADRTHAGYQQSPPVYPSAHRSIRGNDLPGTQRVPDYKQAVFRVRKHRSHSLGSFLSATVLSPYALCLVLPVLYIYLVVVGTSASGFWVGAFVVLLPQLLEHPVDECADRPLLVALA